METGELSFEATFAEMARDREVMDEVHEMEGTVGDGFDVTNTLNWPPRA